MKTGADLIAYPCHCLHLGT